jgi:hypothetical protein
MANEAGGTAVILPHSWTGTAPDTSRAGTNYFEYIYAFWTVSKASRRVPSRLPATGGDQGLIVHRLSLPATPAGNLNGIAGGGDDPAHQTLHMIEP